MAEKNKYRFKGHESFILREGWLNKGLYEVSKNPKVFNENYGADALGVGPNMAKAIRYWMKCAGLTEDSAKKGTELSELGKIIFEKDPYLENIFTLWLLHCKIVMNQSLSTAWYLFFNEFSYEEFEKTQMTEEMIDLAAEVAGEEKKVPDSSVIADCDAILHMYVRRKTEGVNPEEKNISPFGKLGLVKFFGNVYTKKQPDNQKLPNEIVLFLLLNLLKENKAISIDELLTIPDGPGRVLNLKRNLLMEQLEDLEAKEKITINRTAGLNMVYLKSEDDILQLVRNYYR